MPVPFPTEFIPYHTASKRSTLHVHRLPFGDGYAQRMPQGINSIEEVWNVEFKGLSQGQGNQLETFLRTWKGIDAVIWRSPDRNADFAWWIEDFERGYGRGMFSSVRVTLKRFSDPYTGGFLQCLPLLSHLDFSQLPGFNNMSVRPELVSDLAMPARRLRYDPRTVYDDLQPLINQNFPVLKTNYRNGLSVIDTGTPFLAGWILDPAPRIEANADFVIWLAAQSEWVGEHWSLVWAGETGGEPSRLHLGRAVGYVNRPEGLLADIRSEIAIGEPGSGTIQSNRIDYDDFMSFSIWTVRRSGGVVRWARNGVEYGAQIYTGPIDLDYVLAYVNTPSRFSGWLGEIGAAEGLTIEQYDELITNLGRKWGITTVNLHE